MIFGSNKKNSLHHGKSGRIVAALDIGTSKVVCLIAKFTENQGIEIIGIGHQASKGVKAGHIVDISLAERVIGQAIHSAEQSARLHLRGNPLEQIIVGTSARNANRFPSEAELSLKGQMINSYHLNKVKNNCLSHDIPDSMEIIHKISFGFNIDGNDHIKNPVGIAANTLKTRALEIAVPALPLRNLSAAVEANHIDIELFCLNPYASSLGAMVEEESEMNAIMVDIGAGTSDISMFSEGHLVYTTSLPIGGNHITSDIAKGLTTPVAHAERIKTLYGSALHSPLNDRDLIDVPLIGEDDIANNIQIPRSDLLGIIKPRLDEIFEMIRATIDDSGLSDLCGRRVILTGGTSQMPGIGALAEFVLDKQIRIGKPNLHEKISNPIFSSASGLLLYGFNHIDETPKVTSPYSNWSVIDQLKQWVRDNW